MSGKYEKLFEAAGRNGKYQYSIVAIAFGFWVTLDLLSLSIPYLQKTRTIELFDKSQNLTKTFSLNYKLCEDHPNYSNITTDQSLHSWVIEFGIECDQVKTGLIGSYIFIGVLLGSFCFQYFPDIFGRKNTIITSSFLFSLVLLVYNFAKYLEIVMILSVLSQMFAYLGLLTAYVNAIETATPEKRSVYGAVINSAFGFGGVLYVILYKYLDNWRLIFSIVAVTNLVITILFMRYAFESPRFYFAKGDERRVLECMRKIAKFNGKEKELEEEISKMQETCFNQKDEKNKENKMVEEEFLIKKNELTVTESNEGSNYENSMLSFIKYPSLRFIFLSNCFLWFSTSGVYYGLSIYLKHLPGDIYLNGIFFYSVEIIAYFFSGWVINFKQLGRVGSMIILESISLAGYFSLIIFEFDDYYRTVLAFVSRFAITGVYNIVYTYSAEVYPTVVRAKGMGFNSVCARLGAIVFPFMIEFLNKNVIYLFTSLNTVALVLIFFLPETLGKPLEDHIIKI